MIKQLHILFFMLMTSSSLLASDKEATGNKSDEEPTRLNLSQLAAKSDIVAVAQVMDTDYVYTRSFPSEGSAFLRILIGYKLNHPVEEIIEVFESGLHPYECYFETPDVTEEGRRFLVFFRLDPENQERYRGLAEGCALEILVAQDSRYALRYPVEGIALSENLVDLASPFDFRDNYALVEEETLSPADRDAMLSDGHIIPYLDEYKYTHGIDLTTIRRLIDTDALKTK